MKLLKKENSNGWEIKQKCTGKYNGGGGCKARLLINKNDVFRTHYIEAVGPFEHYTYFFYTFKCPVCGVKTDISSKKIPHSVKLKVNKKRSKEKTYHIKLY